MAARKPYTLQDKQAAVRDALRRMEPVHLHWQMLESLYRTGAQREITQLDLNRILPFPVPGAFLRTVNMLLPHLTLLINSVAARDPKFVVTPTDGDPEVVERNGAVAKAVLDYFWRRADATSVLRDMTQDMVVVGNAFAKVGWAYSESTTDRTSEDIASDAQEILAAATELAAESGETISEADLQEILEAVSLTEHLVETDEPYVEYVSPYDMFLPADAKKLNNARWVCQRLRLPMEEVKANPLFDKEAIDGLTTDTGYADPATVAQFETQEEGLPAAFAYVTVYEFYDMRDRTLCIFQVDGKKALYQGEIPYAHRYPPFVHMKNYSDGGSTFWGFGDVENVAGLQLMVNEIMAAEIGDLKRVGNKYFINKKVLTPELAKALAENRPDQVIPVDMPANMSMGEVLQPVQRLATPADNFVMESKLQDYMQRILGISDLQAGSMSSASRVPATAAAAVEGATTTRALEKLVAVERSSREIALRMLALCQQFMDEGKAIRIAGPNAPLWLQVGAEDIDGEFFIDAETGSTQAINPATRARQGQEMLQIIVPALAQLGYDPSNAVRTALSYMGLNPEHLLVRPQQEMAAQPMSPEEEAMGMVPETDAGGQLPPEILAMLSQGGPVSPELNNPDLQGLADLGGAPIPAAGTGDMIL
jgi:hypothetical protein